MMDLDSFLVSLYVQIDDWWKANHPSTTPRPGRPALLSDSEVLTLAVLAQWPRWRSEHDFWRFARAHLRAPTSPTYAARASSTGASEPWSPSCARCSEPSPRSSASLR